MGTEEQWFYKANNQISGPFTNDEIQELITNRTVKRATKVQRNDSDWRSAKLFGAFEFPVIKDVRPWLRYWARTLDLLIWGLVIGLIIGLLEESFVQTRILQYLFGILLLFFWIPIEALLLSSLGTTSGKLMFGIKARDPQGNKLNFQTALKRSFLVWWKGQGAGIPVISFLAHLNGYQNLKHELGTTTWDLDTDTVITHRPRYLWSEIMIYLLIGLLLYERFTSWIEKVR